MQEPGLTFRCPAWSPDVGGQARPTGSGAVKKGGVGRWEGCPVGTRGKPWEGTAASWARKVGEGPGGERWTPTHPAPAPQPAGRVYSPPPPPSRELLAARERETKAVSGERLGGQAAVWRGNQGLLAWQATLGHTHPSFPSSAQSPPASAVQRGGAHRLRGHRPLVTGTQPGEGLPGA